MTAPRRYLTFSLRTLFLALTALAVWLGVIVNRAREQREAVKAIEALGGVVWYDWRIVEQTPTFIQIDIDQTAKPPGPVWLRRLVGDDFFQTAEVVLFGVKEMGGAPVIVDLASLDNPYLSETDILNTIPHFQRLRSLKRLVFPDATMRLSTATINKLKAALPNCEIAAEPLRE